MQIYICIDDTDNLDSPGTGELATRLAEDIVAKNWGTSTFITRHQLYVHPDIPYTSHNSSMCFAAEVEENCLPELVEHASRFLAATSAPGSDPGLCVAPMAAIPSKQPLIDFGRQAKSTVLNKEMAYGLAKELGIHLSEHGGTGDGVIGALAGIGLRLSGNDGRLKGKFKIPTSDDTATVKQLCAHPYIDRVQTLQGEVLPEDARIHLSDKVKAVFLGGKAVVLVSPWEGPRGDVFWQTCSKQQLKVY